MSRVTRPSPVLELNGVTLYREGKKVLSNLNLTIGSGEHWVVLGPNGSGKSSLLTMIQGLLWPQQGTLTVVGKRFGEGNIDHLRRKIGWVGMEIEERFNPSETAESILLSGAVGTVGLQFERPRPSHQKQMKSMTHLLRIQHLRKKAFGKLSQGERRIICIARALMVKPVLLILDEACAGLDPIAREFFLKRLTALGQLPTSPAILFATHHVEEIREPISHVLLLKNGKVVAAGKLKEQLNSGNLEKLFDTPLLLKRYRGRYGLFPKT